MRGSTVSIVALLIVGTCVASMAAPQISGRGSFLDRRADSVQALVQEIRSNPTVSARYARHFNTTPQVVEKYFEQNLRLITLKRATTTTIYYISKDGSITAGKRLLPSGSKVFATGQGVLVLEWRCGNPLLKRLPAQASKPVAKPVPQAEVPKPTVPEVPGPTETAVAAPLVPDTAPITEVAATTPMEIGTLPSAAETLPTTPVVVPVVPTVTPPVVTTTVPATTVPPVISSGGGKGFLLIPLLLGGAALGGGGGGGHESPVVPEPGSLLALSAVFPAAGLVIRHRRK